MGMSGWIEEEEEEEEEDEADMPAEVAGPEPADGPDILSNWIEDELGIPADVPGPEPARDPAAKKRPASGTGRLWIRAEECPFPIQIRDHAQSSSIWVIGSRRLDLQPGYYVISSRPPGGQAYSKTCKIQHEAECLVDFSVLATSEPLGRADPSFARGDSSSSSSSLASLARESLSAGMAFRYLKSGQLEEADQLLIQAENLALFRDLDDSIAVAAGGYGLLSLGANNRVNPWAESFAARFPEFPDAAIIFGENLARRSRRPEALAQFLRVERLEGPLFTEGFSILYSRLNEFIESASMARVVRAKDRIVCGNLERATEFRDRLRTIANRLDYSSFKLALSEPDHDLAPRLPPQKATEHEPLTPFPEIPGFPDANRESPARGRKPRRVLQGLVTSAKMDKTRRVEVVGIEPHPKYGKMIRRRTICYAHDERNLSRYGDLVEIMETRPLSKIKRWRWSESSASHAIRAPGPSVLDNQTTSRCGIRESKSSQLSVVELDQPSPTA